MNEYNDNSALSHCQAFPDDPKISVHELTEYVFCRRAGLVTREQPIEDQERDQLPGLSYLDNYEPQLIEQHYADQCEALKKYAAFSAPPVATTMVCFFSGAVFPGLVLLGITVAICWRASPHLRAARECQRRLREIERTQDVSVDLFAPQPQHMIWWALLSRFQLLRGTRVYHDDQCRLCGSMQGVLVEGSLRIPVFWLRAMPRDKTLKEQHFVRMAAYCHLLETCEGAQSPCGAIVLPNSFNCVTIPNTVSARQKLFHTLSAARKTIRHAEQGNDPPPPPPGRCSSCPLGKPVPLGDPNDREDWADSALNDIFVSPCGARFHWDPPYHKYAN